MSTTARVAITDALYLLRVIAAEETPEAYQLVDGLRFMNRMLHSLKASSADIGYQDITLDDALPLPPEHIDPVVYMLAATMAPLYGAQLTPEVAVMAKDAKTTLQSAYKLRSLLRVDPAFQELAGNRAYYDGTE